MFTDRRTYGELLGAEERIATNVLAADTCVITPIGLDHVEILGDTLASVAGEKVGIVHEGARGGWRRRFRREPAPAAR